MKLKQLKKTKNKMLRQSQKIIEITSLERC